MPRTFNSTPEEFVRHLISQGRRIRPVRLGGEWTHTRMWSTFGSGGAWSRLTVAGEIPAPVRSERTDGQFVTEVRDVRAADGRPFVALSQRGDSIADWDADERVLAAHAYASAELLDSLTCGCGCGRTILACDDAARQMSSERLSDAEARFRSKVRQSNAERAAGNGDRAREIDYEVMCAEHNLEHWHALALREGAPDPYQGRYLSAVIREIYAQP